MLSRLGLVSRLREVSTAVHTGRSSEIGRFEGFGEVDITEMESDGFLRHGCRGQTGKWSKLKILFVLGRWRELYEG